MPVTLPDLDPDVAQVLREALPQLPQAKGISAPMVAKDWLIVALPAVCTGGPALTGATLLFNPSVGGGVLFAASLVAAGLGLRYFSHAADQMNARQVDVLFTLDLLQKLPATLPFSQAEWAYVEGVLALLKVQGALRTEPTHELLTTLNGLLRAARRLEQEKARFSRQSVAELLAERAILQARLEQTTDPLTRQTWAENLALLERRLAQAQTEAPLRERIDAQWEGALQSLRTTQMLLASLTPSPLPLPLDTLREEVRQLRARTQAVEAALQEVGLP